jgi:hypothetical protein
MANDRAVQALAQLLCDGSDSISAIVPWSHRRPAVKNTWLVVARRQLSRPGPPGTAPPGISGSAADGGGWDVASRSPGEQAVLGVYSKHGMGARPLSLSTLIQETGLEAELLIHAVFRLVGRGLMDEMDMSSGNEDQPTFRLLTAGKAVLPASGTVLPVAAKRPGASVARHP